MELSTQNIFNYQKMIDRATAGVPNKEKTFARWQEKAILMRSAMLEVKRSHEEELSKIKETYNPKSPLYEQKVTTENDIYNTVKTRAVKKLEEELNDLVENKRSTFDKNMDAPSPESLRLLEALNMRESLTPAEIVAVSGKFAHNIPSIRVLRDIAHRHGVEFPDVGNPDIFEQQLTRAYQFSLDKLKSIDVESANLSYKDLLFYQHPGSGEVKTFYGVLDGSGLTTEQITAIPKHDSTKPTETRTESPQQRNETSETSEVWAEVTCTGNEYLSTIASQFHVSRRDIENANPGRTLDRLYAGDKIYVPSTKFTFLPDPSGGHIQPDQVKAVPKPVDVYPTGPNGESIGDDVIISA